jgi:CRISPR-associated endoribonuclease Cas6
MRLKLTLKSKDYSPLPLNHNYALSSAIYNLLRLGSPEFSNFLHSTGFKLNGHSYKLFSFALKFQDYKIHNNTINFISPYAYLYIASPLIDDFIKNFVIGTFTDRQIEIYAEYIKCVLRIHQAELLPEPHLNNTTKFNLLSPLVLSTKKIHNGKLKQHFLNYDDDIFEINRIFNSNLKSKYNIIYDKEYSGDGVTLSWDQDYIDKAIRNKKRLTKKISITKDLGNPINIIAMKPNFSLKGDTTLMNVGCQCGFGEKNSMGFGMVAI